MGKITKTDKNGQSPAWNVCFVQIMTTVKNSTVVTLSVSSRMFGLVMWSLHCCTNWHFVVCDCFSPQHDISLNHLNLNCMYTILQRCNRVKSWKETSVKKNKEAVVHCIDVEGLRSCLSTICQCGSNSGIMISLMIRDHLGLLCPVVLVGILRSIRGGARKTFPHFIVWEHRNKNPLKNKQKKKIKVVAFQTKTKLQPPTFDWNLALKCWPNLSL